MNTQHSENRGHSDYEISAWVDGEGRVDLDKLTAEDLEAVNVQISVKRLLQKLRVAVTRGTQPATYKKSYEK